MILIMIAISLIVVNVSNISQSGIISKEGNQEDTKGVRKIYIEIRGDDLCGLFESHE